MQTTENQTALSLSQTEFSSIDEYRKKKNTAVLTIMFTDIQGFTALTENNGESYVHDLHQMHDKILVETIEEDNAGVVIKYIGDSIMAVFAEPTAAAEKALRIQQKLHDFNKAHPELDDIKVRIGLHMGQTVIENKMQTDLFGRHVNKASRVESLAAGGHIFISYPVFDSIKSWLMDTANTGSKLHGSYFLKGIDKAEEIYEIYNTAITHPEAPKKAKKKNAIPLIVPALIAAVVIVVALSIFLIDRGNRGADTQAARQDPTAKPEASAQPAAQAVVQPTAQKSVTAETTRPAKPVQKEAAPPVKTPEIYFLGMIAREPILDFDTPLAVTLENEAQGLKKSVNDIAPGKHIIHFIVSYMVRYYAEINVKPGKNVIQVAFKESYLPGVDVDYSLSADSTKPATASDEENYFLFDHKTLNRLDYKGKVSAEVKGAKATDGTVTFNIHYTVKLNDKDIVDKTLSVESPPNATDRKYVAEQILYESTDHYYFIKYSYIGDSIQVNLGASFKD